MRKILLFISILSIFVSHLTLAGTTGKLTGKATDAKTNESLPFVNITLQVPPLVPLRILTVIM